MPSLTIRVPSGSCALSCLFRARLRILQGRPCFCQLAPLGPSPASSPSRSPQLPFLFRPIFHFLLIPFDYHTFVQLGAGMQSLFSLALHPTLRPPWHQKPNFSRSPGPPQAQKLGLDGGPEAEGSPQGPLLHAYGPPPQPETQNCFLW